MLPVAMTVPPNEPFADHASVASAAAALHELDNYVMYFTHTGSQLKEHIYERSRHWYAVGEAQRDTLRTPADVRARQEKIRHDLIASLGGLPSSATPLNPRITGEVKGPGFRIEKVIFEARPHHYVTANLYLPDHLSRPAPAVLFLCGHIIPSRLGPAYQSVCQALAHAGMIVLAQDPVGQGERYSYLDPATGKPLVPPGTREHDTAGAQARFVGDGLARYFLHDAMRGVDYLLSRPEVDPKRIGVTGNSGGGTQVSLVMMADPRIAAAAPGTFIMSRDSYQRTGQSQDAEQIWSGFTRAGYDHEDILLAMAPKPVCVLAVTSDFFPIEGTRRTVNRARRIWELFPGAPALELVEDNAIHGYTPALARAAARFFSRQFFGREADMTGFTPQPLPDAEVACTKSGQVQTEFADAEFVFDATHARAAELERARQKLPAAERRTRALAWLKDQVWRDRDSAPLGTRWIERGRRVGPFAVEIAYWWPQSQLASMGALLRLPGAPANQPVTVAVWDDGLSAISKHAAWLLRECQSGRAVLVMNPSGIGPLRPDAINPYPMQEFYGTLHKLSDDLDWIGDSLVALRTYEVLRSVEALAEWPELNRADVRFYGQGRMGVHAWLAAVLQPKPVACEWADRFRFADFTATRLYEARDVKSVVFPGVLRYFDTDEL